MRIAHVGVAGPFTENMSYQDNILSHQNALDGHEVLYISNEYFFKNGELVKGGFATMFYQTASGSFDYLMFLSEIILYRISSVR